jgi:UDP-N-acetyl-D-mannosaminuronate dehydrogenase
MWFLRGITFKENCPDIRNTCAIDIHKEFLFLNLSTLKSTGTLIYDVKGILPTNIPDSRL